MESCKCLICNKDVASNYILAKYNICKSCFNQFKFIYETINISDVKCFIIYKYNDFFKQALVNVKGYKDKELAKVFLSPIKDFIKSKYSGYTLIPVPSSNSSNAKRSFNHVQEIFNVLDMPMCCCLIKKTNYKQSNQNKYLRTKIDDEIVIDKSKLIPIKKALIIDDVTTTHRTIIACIKKLKSIGITNIKSLVLSKR